MREARSPPADIFVKRTKAMDTQDITRDIAGIVNDPDLSKSEKIDKLESMREGVRQEMRAASESAMVDDNRIGDELKHLDEALDKLGSDKASIEDGGGATL